jgi:hypothetical protein
MNRLSKIVAFAVVSLVAGLAWAAPTSQPDPLDSLARKSRDLKEAQDKQAADQKTPTSTVVDVIPLKDRPVEGGAAPTAGDAEAGADDAQDESELVKALLRKAGGAEDPVMDRVIKGMTKSREGLREKFDTGDQTQLVQAKIVDDLTEAIKAAAAAQSSSKGSGKSQSQGQGQAQGQPPGEGSKPGNSIGGTQAATESQLRQGSAQNGQVNADIKQGRTEWGSLPARDRSEIVTGHSEEGLPLWEEMINRYYESLAAQSSNK